MSGEPVVMVPPMLCDARVFQVQIADLSCDHALLFAPTLHSAQMAETAARLLEWAPPEFALVGAGMGGMVALEVLRRAPERVTRIALINTTAQADTPKTAADREPHIVAAKSGRFEDVVADAADPARLGPDADAAALTPLLRNMAERIGATAYVRQARAVQKRNDMQAVLRQVKQPALVISSDRDAENPLRRQSFVAEMIPYAKHEVIENTGFMPTLEQPEKLAHILRDWLRQPLILR